MSTNYDLYCPQCSAALCCVATSSEKYGNTLWAGETEVVELRRFLFRHRGHQLLFDTSEIVACLLPGETYDS